MKPSKKLSKLMNHSRKENYLEKLKEDKTAQSKRRFLLLSLLLISVIGFVFAFPIITYGSSNTINDTSTSNYSVPYNFSIDNLGEGTKKVIFGFGEVGSVVNYTIFDKDTCIFNSNFENNSNFGENDSLVYNICGLANATCSGTACPKWNVTGGYAGTGAFEFDGVNDKMDLGTNYNFDNNSYSISLCYKIRGNASSSNYQEIFNKNSYNYRVFWFGSNWYTSLTMENENRSQHLGATFGQTPMDKFDCVSFSFNETLNITSLYFNGLYVTSFQNNGTGDTTDNFTLGYMAENNWYGNITVDKLLITNRSWSNDEAYEDYLSYYLKKDTNLSTVYINQYFTKFPNSTKPLIVYNNYLCVLNNSNNENCSDTNNLNQILDVVNINSPFSASLGEVKVSYGSDSHYALYTGNKLDVNNDGILEYPRNTTWNREAWLNSGQNTIRQDMYRSGYYSLFINMGFERWTTNTTFSIAYSANCQGVLGWSCGSYGSGGNFTQTFSQSTDAHSGSYSLNVSENQTNSIAFPYQSFTLPAENHSYNWTGWVKGQIGKSIRIQGGWNDNTISVCNFDIIANGSWQYFNCPFTSNGTYTVIRLNAGNAYFNQSYLIDDVNLYSDNVIKNYINYKSLQNITDLVQWSCDNNQTISFIADGVTQVTTSTCYNNIEGYCKGTINWDESFVPSVVDYLKIVTKNKTNSKCVQVEVGNEYYYFNNWYANISSNQTIEVNSVNGSLEYMRLFNSTIYGVKQFDSSIKVAGPCGYRIAPTFLLTFLSNHSLLSYPADIHSMHPYDSGTVNNLQQIKDMDSYRANCTIYGVNCTLMSPSEWSIGSQVMKNTSSYSKQYTNSWAQSYISFVNAPYYISSMLYQWADPHPYWVNSTGGHNFAEYPTFWSMVTEPELINLSVLNETIYHENYNSTKMFSKLCPTGTGEVWNTTNDGINITQTSCSIGNMKNIIIEYHGGVKSYNFTINTSTSGISNLTYVLNHSKVLNVNNLGISSVIVDPYETLYLTSDLQFPLININSPTYSNYTNSLIDYNISGNEELSSANGSLDGGASFNLNPTGVNYIYNLLQQTISDGSHNLCISGNDTSNNWNTTCVSFSVDTTNPNASFITPINNTVSNNPNVNLTANLTDQTSLQNATLNIFNILGVNVFNITNTAIYGLTYYIWENIVPLIDGIYNAFISVFDSSNHNYVTQNQTFTIDTLVPYFTSIPNNSTLEYGVDSLGVDFDASDLNFGYYSINWTNNFTINQSGYLINSTKLYIGTYLINVSINDSANNLNSTIYQVIVRDTISPNINFTNPTTNSGNYSKSDIYVNVSSNDTNINHTLIDNIGLKLLILGNNMSGENNTYFKDYSGNGNDGYGNNTVYVDGKYGKAISFNGINSSVKILSNPSSFNITDKITLFATINVSKYTCFSRILAKATISSSSPYTIYGLLLDCNTSTYLNAGVKSVRMELASNNSQHFIRSTTSLQEGQVYAIIGTYDSSTGNAELWINGNLDNSTLYKTIKESPFNISVVNNLTNGLIDTNLNNLSIGCSLYNNVPSNLFNGSVSLAGVDNRIWTTSEKKAYFDASLNQLDTNITGLSDGVYNLSVLTLDRVGNFNQTEYRYITLDTTGSSVTLVSPEDGTEDSDGVVNFIFNVSDVNTINNCSLYSQFGRYSTKSDIIKGLNTIEVVSINSLNILYMEDLQWKISCTDNFNNIGNSRIRHLDTIPPYTGSPGGAGGVTGTTDLNKNPKYIELSYPKVWFRNSEVQVKVYTYSLNGSLYYPVQIEYDSIPDGIVLEDSIKDGAIITKFKVYNNATLGNKSINLKIIDERNVSNKISFEIQKSSIIEENIQNIKNNPYALAVIIGGGFFLLIIIILVIAISIKSKKKDE
jgi:hypothetical protein